MIGEIVLGGLASITLISISSMRLAKFLVELDSEESKVIDKDAIKLSFQRQREIVEKARERWVEEYEVEARRDRNSRDAVNAWTGIKTCEERLLSLAREEGKLP